MKNHLMDQYKLLDAERRRIVQKYEYGRPVGDDFTRVTSIIDRMYTIADHIMDLEEQENA